ncbi:hypothetical protein T439DRAFT_330191 [Meredithblackwellia eburnea MCA 4105]
MHLPKPRIRLSESRKLLENQPCRRVSSTILSRSSPRPVATTSLSRATRVLLHPASFLIHLSSITLGAMMLPTIAASNTAASRRRDLTNTATCPAPSSSPKVDDDEEPDVGGKPTPYQLYTLANQIYTQVQTSPSSAGFTIRQLHLFKRPRVPSPSQELLPWIWSEPATAILRGFFEVGPEKRLKLQREVFRVAENSLVWDTRLAIQCAQATQGQESTVRTLESGIVRTLSGRGDCGPTSFKGLYEKVEKVPPIQGGLVQSWEVRPPASTLSPAPAAPAFAQYTSIPMEVLHALILHMTVIDFSSAVALLRLLASLRIPGSVPTFAEPFIEALLERKRQDLAALLWSDWFHSLFSSNSLDSSNSSTNSLDTRQISPFDPIPQLPAPPTFDLESQFRYVRRSLGPLEVNLRHEAARYTSPSIAAIMTLSDVLEREWEARGFVQGTTGALIRILQTVPPCTTLRSKRTAHRRARVVLGKIVQDLVAQPILIRDSHALVEQHPSRGTAQHDAERNAERKSRSMTTIAFNNLISYSLKHFNSPTLAIALYHRLKACSELRPSTVTHNLIRTLLPTGKMRVEDVLESVEHNPYALPGVLASLRTPEELALLPSLVFGLLPELDQTIQQLSGPPSSNETPYRQHSSSHPAHSAPDSHPHRAFASAPTAVPPERGRSPFLYTTLLQAVVRAGQTGLAERVFRLTRWAAERSREPESGETPWVVPAAAFQAMLQLYAMEVRRGRRGMGQEKGMLKGWGRQAVRDFRREKAAEMLVARLGSGMEENANRNQRASRFDENLPIRRDVAAPIAAMWELEGGSKEEERRVMQQVLRSDEAHKSLAYLLEYSETQREDGGDRSRTKWTKFRWERPVAVRGSMVRHHRRMGMDRLRRTSHALRNKKFYSRKKLVAAN